MADEITIRPYRSGDEAGLLAGHARIFGPRTLAHWQWKFRDNPAGRMHIVVAEHATAGIVGAYVTLPVRCTLEGAPCLAGQPVDLFVLPEYRRAGPRPGLFVALALDHFERYGGQGEHQNVMHYGWPVGTWRIGQKYLGYELLREWSVLFRERPAAGFPPRAVAGALEVRAVARFDADVDRLWAGFGQKVVFGAVRDARYLNWRYADAHDASYELYECRQRDGALRGIAVVTHRDFVLPNAHFLVDWMAAPDDVEVTVALLSAAERSADRAGAAVLATQFPPRDVRFLTFQRLGFLVHGTDYVQGVRPFDAHDAGFYRQHWYQTLGDSDLV